LSVRRVVVESWTNLARRRSTTRLRRVVGAGLNRGRRAGPRGNLFPGLECGS
jgi:hypothetical protein